MKKFDLNERLIDNAVAVLKLTDQLTYSVVNKHLAHQLIRSITSTSLNYGEAQGAESAKDFIHKMKIIQKELRESMNNMLILQKYGSISDSSPEIEETNELIAIITASIKTAKKKL